MDFNAFLNDVRRSRHYRDQIVYVHKIPRRDAQFGALSQPLPPQLSSVLEKMNITELYTHQTEAVEKIRAGQSVVTVTSTASGKTLCYNIPVLETLLGNPSSKALYLFPTKALAQDQLRGLRRYGEMEPALAQVLKAGAYDGDTPPTTRRKLRDQASIILTNPDMLHQGILPHHSRWSSFLTDLRYVVLDEIHTYRGIFGSNVANVIRRLNRICRYYGSNPQFICSSATIANPLDLAEKLTGIPMTLVDNDGSPRGEKRFILWNPPCIDAANMERRSSNVEAQDLMVDLMRNGVRTIAFGRARIVAELMYRYVREALEKREPKLASKIRAYRGGYLPEERREIERQLFSGELMGITSTNALELGIDIGGLDAAIIVGFPGTIASTWQQAGRAGRGPGESLVIFVAYNDPMDQYLMRHPEYFLGQSPENAVVDPQNPYVLTSHLKCAAYELPLKEKSDAQWFGRNVGEIARIVEESRDVKEINGDFYWSSTKFPAADVNLRTISDDTFTIVEVSGSKSQVSGKGSCEPGSWRGDQPTAQEMIAPQGTPSPLAGEGRVRGPDLHSAKASPPLSSGVAGTGGAPGNRVIGQVDAISAPELVYPQAIYMHDAETYFVDELDLVAKVAYVRRADVDYYTNAVLDAGIRVKGAPTEKRWNNSRVCFGEATVTWATTGFKKIKFYSLDSIGYGKVDIPAQHLETMALWIVPPSEIMDEVRRTGRNPIEGLMGVRNLAVHALPLFAMCDKQDIGGIVDSSNTGEPTMFIYDRYSGGLGFAETGYEMVEKLMRACLDMILECGCVDGCPSCVGMPVLRPAIHTDPDVFGSFPIPDKEAGMVILRAMV